MNSVRCAVFFFVVDAPRHLGDQLLAGVFVEREDLPRVNVLTVVHLNRPARFNVVLLAEDFAVDHGGDADTLTAREPQHAADVGDDCLALRLLARFEQFLDARQTAGDVAGCLCRTAGVEGTER